MRWPRALSWYSLQLMLCWPAGQPTRCLSQSTRKASMPKAPSRRCCQLTSWGVGPTRSIPCTLPGLHKLSGAHVGGINQMRARGQSLAGERGMNGAGAPGPVNAGRCGVDVDHQARGVRVAGLREMDQIARPAHLALGAKARLHVVGRLDAIRAAAKRADRAKPCAMLSGGPAAAL